MPVVVESHRPWWKHILASFSEDAIVVQPENRGTAAAILLSLLRVARGDPEATILVMPSDHFVESEEAFASSLRQTVFHADRQPDRVILLGITPDQPESDYGWIVPLGSPGPEPRSVVRFVEKPDAEHATRLMGDGGLWNSFVFACRARALLRMYRRTQADLLDLFLQHFRAFGEPAVEWERLYAEIPSRDFSRDVLQAAPEDLRVLRAVPCGWTDLGSPARLSRWRARRASALRSLVVAGSKIDPPSESTRRVLERSAPP
jgi:mannose-1-phosphate guanylyltransferase